MVQTYQSPVRVYKYPFELVMAAYEKRFPTCPQIPIFVGSEILSEYCSPDSAVEVVERKCQLNFDAPYFVKKIAGVDYVYFNQKNSLDRRKRTLLIEASNISFATLGNVKENCCYYVHPENESWTCFEQSASLDVKSFFGFETVIEKLAVKQYAVNLAKGKEVLEFFIDELIKSGVTSVPRWTPPEGVAVVQSASSADSTIDASKNGEPSDELSHPNGHLNHGNHKSKETTNSVPHGGMGRRPSSGASNPAVSQVTRALSMTHAAPSSLSTSFDDPDEKLETEYIHRVLGPLTPLEESRLCELKYGLRAAHKGKIPNDAHLLRFLRARDFDVSKARDMLLASLLWRKRHNVDKILNDFVPPPVFMKYFPGCWHHHDLEDRSVFVLRLGQMDVKGILRAAGLEAVVKFTLSVCEEGLLKAANATRHLGKPISTWTLLVDMDGLSFRHAWRPGVQSLLRIIETVEAHYPETMGQVLVVRAPRVFPVLWTLVSPFINENTRRKFIIQGSDNLLAEISKYINKEFIPDFLGGSCPFEVKAPPEGWLVPKTEYQPIDFDTLLRETEHHLLTSPYTTININRNHPHEIYVHVPSAGGLLTWDFDVIKGDCEFAVYFTNDHLKKQTPVTSPSSGNSSMNPVEFVTAAIGASSLRGGNSSPATQPPTQQPVIYSDPELQLGRDLRVIAKQISFSEGDSMQGSHFCSRTGTYILQWHIRNEHNVPAVESSSSQTGDTSHTSSGGSHHKCKVMYYYELLDSEGFRGSVQSLESYRSSYSSQAAPGETGEGSMPSNKPKKP